MPRDVSLGANRKMSVPTISEGLSDADVAALTIRAFEKGRAAAMYEVAQEVNRRARRVADRERKMAKGLMPATPAD